MKQITLLFGCLLLAATGFAQLPNGANAPNFKARDINGREWNLYDVLESGRPVVMDVSATWCGPCWSYHNSHALETLYETHGPAGDGQVMVFFIEGDAATNTACLYGPSGCNNSTQGNWVANTPYPIIDNSGIGNSYAVSYFPTVYLICPDKTVNEVGQVNATALWNAAAPCVGNIPQHYATMNSLRSGTLSHQLCGAQSGSPEISMTNLGSDPLTDAVVDLKWNGTTIQTKTYTGNTLPLDIATLSFDQIEVSGPGTLTAEIVSLNGGNPNAQLATASVAFEDAPATFATEQIQLRVRTDAGGNDIYWEMYDEAGNVIDHGGNEAVGPNGGGLYPTGSPSDPTAYGNNVLIRDTLTVPASGCFTLRVFDGAGNGIGFPGYVRMYPLGSNTQFFNSPVIYGADFSTTQAKITTGVKENSDVELTELYPNPANNVLTLEMNLLRPASVQLSVLNTVGQTVYSEASRNMPQGEQQYNLSVAQLSPGIYFLHIDSDHGSSVQRFVVAR
ncbi:MAG: T9SS type A sorting domain-containing protein [Lewinellaceae bacterium]|nr:T9SS type A sorting domain-containing protein [Lewinellaceae bacterium]